MKVLVAILGILICASWTVAATSTASAARLGGQKAFASGTEKGYGKKGQRGKKLKHGPAFKQNKQN